MKDISDNKLCHDFIELRNQCIIIQRDFNTYNALFFSGSDDLLIKIAPRFFSDLAEIMQRDWILQVCKLLDPAATKVRGKSLENLSIKLINDQLEAKNIINNKISCLAESIFAYGENLLPARNKRLAHLDREYHFSGETLGATSESELNKFLNNLQEYCDAVGNVIGIGPLDFSSSSCPGDVYDLLSILYNCTE